MVDDELARVQGYDYTGNQTWAYNITPTHLKDSLSFPPTFPFMYVHSFSLPHILWERS
jgi:hypothetical protein